jgi:hypothetical protein
MADKTEFFTQDAWTDDGRYIARRIDCAMQELLREVLDDYPDADLRHVAYMITEAAGGAVRQEVLDRRFKVGKYDDTPRDVRAVRDVLVARGMADQHADERARNIVMGLDGGEPTAPSEHRLLAVIDMLTPAPHRPGFADGEVRHHAAEAVIKAWSNN